MARGAALAAFRETLEAFVGDRSEQDEWYERAVGLTAAAGTPWFVWPTPDSDWVEIDDDADYCASVTSSRAGRTADARALDRDPRACSRSATAASARPARAAADATFDTARVCVGSGLRARPLPLADGDRRRPAGGGLEWSIASADLDGRLDQAAELAAQTIRSDATLLIGVGGGRVIDTVKLAAARTGTDFVSVPTAISHDGISSPVASLAGDGQAARVVRGRDAGRDHRRPRLVASAPDADAPRRRRRPAQQPRPPLLDWRLADRARPRPLRRRSRR